MQKKLVLVASDKMDANKKEDRKEHSLIRMASTTRANLKFNKKKVELKPTSNATTALKLDIFQAYSSDLKKIKNKIKNGELTSEEANRVGFVTTSTYKKILGNRKQKNIWISNGADKVEQIENLIVGSDPEFLLFDNNGNVIRANNVMAKPGKLGNDGAMAEIRPSPSISPNELVKNMKDIFSNTKLTHNIKDYDWIASCYHKDNVRDYPVGGHIHIGNPRKVASMHTTQRYQFFKAINKILDELLAVPLIKLDGAEKGSARRTHCQMSMGGGGYGWYGEWRPSDGHFEHRTLSGLWLSHPVLATAVIGTARAIAKEIFRYGAEHDYDIKYLFPETFWNKQIWNANFNSWGDIPLVRDMRCNASSKEIKGLLHNSRESDITKTYLRTWYSKIKGMATYKKHCKYIDALYEILSHSKKDLDDYDRNIKKNWLEGRKYLINI